MLSQLMRGGSLDILGILLSIPCVLIALSFHEAAHGYAAYKMGDPTARNFGRLTLNPLKHFDLIGGLCMLLCGFGWAKPVPINTRYFKNQKKGMALSALAGPLTNIALGIIGMLLYRIVLAAFCASGVFFNINGFIYISPNTNETAIAFAQAICMLLEYFYYLNFSLAFFNLIPIPPFDGSRVLFAFLPDKYYFGIMKYEQYIMIGVLVLLAFGPSFLSMSSIVGAVESALHSLFDLIPFLSLK